MTQTPQLSLQLAPMVPYSLMMFQIVQKDFVKGDTDSFCEITVAPSYWQQASDYGKGDPADQKLHLTCNDCRAKGCYGPCSWCGRMLCDYCMSDHYWWHTGGTEALKFLRLGCHPETCSSR